MTVENGQPRSSRTSESAAGWGCKEIGSFAACVPDNRRMSWFNPRALWLSRNDVVARSLHDPVEQRRSALGPGRSDAELTVDITDTWDTFSFLLLGDTGEGDE